MTSVELSSYWRASDVVADASNKAHVFQKGQIVSPTAISMSFRKVDLYERVSTQPTIFFVVINAGSSSMELKPIPTRFKYMLHNESNNLAQHYCIETKTLCPLHSFVDIEQDMRDIYISASPAVKELIDSGRMTVEVEPVDVGDQLMRIPSLVAKFEKDKCTWRLCCDTFRRRVEVVRRCKNRQNDTNTVVEIQKVRFYDFVLIEFWSLRAL